MATPRPADSPAPADPEPQPDARQQYRAAFYERVGGERPTLPADGFAPDSAGERAEVEWSLNTLAAHGAEWLDRGFALLDAPTPEIRERMLIDAIREAPVDALRAMGGLIRGVEAHPERDMAASWAARAVHLALTGRGDEATRVIQSHWRSEYAGKGDVMNAIVDRHSGSGDERTALNSVAVALLTCD